MTQRIALVTGASRGIIKQSPNVWQMKAILSSAPATSEKGAAAVNDYLQN